MIKAEAGYGPLLKGEERFAGRGSPPILRARICLRQRNSCLKAQALVFIDISFSVMYSMGGMMWGWAGANFGGESRGHGAPAAASFGSYNDYKPEILL